MSWTVADAVDYKGFPADRSKTGGWIPAALILGLFVCLFVYYYIYHSLTMHFSLHIISLISFVVGDENYFHILPYHIHLLPTPHTNEKQLLFSLQLLYLLNY